MSIRMKIALVLLIVFVMGTGALVFTVRSAYLGNVGIVSERLVAGASALYTSTSQSTGSGAAGRDRVVGRMKELTGDDYAVLTRTGDGYEVAAATSEGLRAFDAAALPAALKDGVNRIELVTSGESPKLLAAIPVGSDVLLVDKDIAGLMASMQGAPLLVVGLLVFIYVITVGAVILLLNALVFGRLLEMATRIEDAILHMAGGQYSAFDIERPVVKDEIGHFEQTLFAFMRLVGSTLKQLTPADTQGAPRSGSAG